MDFRRSSANYDLLYAKWLENPGKLLDMVGWKPGMRLLDLCGGTGAIALEALRRGAKEGDVVLLDVDPRCPDPRVLKIRGEAERLGEHLWYEKFDIVICRQSVSFLDVSSSPGLAMFPAIHDLLNPGGRLVFNTFAKPRWLVKPYRYKGRWFLEVSAYIGRQVFHLQAGHGLGTDVTAFRWHDPQALAMQVSRAGFDTVDLIDGGKSVYVLASKRP